MLESIFLGNLAEEEKQIKNKCTENKLNVFFELFMFCLNLFRSLLEEIKSKSNKFQSNKQTDKGTSS